MKIHLILIFALLISSCKNSSEQAYITKNESVNTFQENDNIHPGEKLMKNYCTVCHSPSASEDNRLAPPMIAIKKRYLRGNVSKSDFIKSIQKVIENPIENGKMYGAINRFGNMPKAHYPKGTILQIATYIYDYEIEQPAWFDAHYKNNTKQRN